MKKIMEIISIVVMLAFFVIASGIESMGAWGLIPLCVCIAWLWFYGWYSRKEKK